LLPGIRARARAAAGDSGINPTIVFMGRRSTEDGLTRKTELSLYYPLIIHETIFWPTCLYTFSKTALHAIVDPYGSELALEPLVSKGSSHASVTLVEDRIRPMRRNW